MRDFAAFLALPATLLCFIASNGAAADALEWPYNLPPTVKYHPEHEPLVKRQLEAKEKLASQRPVGMRKMSEDEGEMFYMHYWDFGDKADEADSTGRGGATLSSNTSISLSAPLAPHFSGRRGYGLSGRSIFARQWGACPAGSASCTSIDRPNSCCQTGEICIIVSDTGNGDAGCCPQGETCGNTISSCDASAGQTQCSGAGSGGCCIAGYTCYDVGCVLANTQTVVTTLPVETVTTGQSSSQTFSTASGTSVGVAGVGSVYTTTIFQVSTATAPGSTGTVTSVTTVTLAPSSSPGTTVIAGQGPLTCSPGFQSCPASLGGGCCQSGYACGAVACGTATTSTTTEASALPPARPTSSADSTVVVAGGLTTAASSTSLINNDNCPTGFYVCSAYYIGGCCRVGRDCASTSCPASESTAVVSSGVTVVAPAGATQYSTTTVGGASSGASAAAGTQGNCANGFYLCGADQGGGCCASGYVCGTSICAATASGVAGQAKTTPSEGSILGLAWSLVVVGVASPRQPRSNSKHRSSTNLSNLRLAPLSARFADTAPKKTSAPRSPYEEAADFTFARHDASYIGGKSAPTTPGVLSRSGSRRHMAGGLSRRGSLYDDQGEEVAGGDEGLGVGGGMVKAKSEATLATRERLAGYGVPLRKRQSGQQRSRTNGTTTPGVRSRVQHNEDWLSRATTATNALLQESKGQTWIATRDSSASLHLASSEDDDADEGYEEMAASAIPQSRPRTAASTSVTPRPQTWGSRFGSRPASRRTSRRGSVSRTPGVPVAESSATYFDHPALNEVSSPTSSRSASPDVNEAELEALTQNQATGFGGLVDRVMGFSIFGTAESEESGADTELDRQRNRDQAVPRRRAQLPPPPARQNTAEGEQVGLWEDAAWLLSVAGRALT
nr:hypothetical protein B0A51_01104 [Rachicladosporium sp. CCFEE 5018]